MMILREKIIISMLVVLLILLITTFTLPITGKFESVAEVEKSDLSGEILSVEHQPDVPKIFERFAITTVARNNGKEKNNYLLSIQIAKDGQVKYNDELTFSLLPDKSVSLSPDYNPEDVGEHQIVIRLYSMDKSKLYDEKIFNFIVWSDVGPFDLEVDMPSHIIGLGDSLPATVIIKNVGISGTDIGLNLELRCKSGRIITNDMYFLVENSSYTKKEVIMSTCGEVGQHSLVTSLVLYNKSLLISKNQFYVNETMPKVLMNTQTLLKAKAGERTNFSIELTNPNNFDLINIEPFVYGMPPDSLSISPPRFNLLEPNETVIFTATTNLPENTEAKDYGITIGIGGDNVFYKNDAVLSVSGAAIKTFVPDPSVYNLLSSYRFVIAFVFAIILLIYSYSTLSSYSNRVYLRMRIENFRVSIRKLIDKIKMKY
jgi:hypothetical protein